MLFENLTFGYQRKLESGLAALHELLGAMERTVIEQSTRLEKTLEMAQRASRAKSEFLSTMSHEIRTPMNAVLGMADMLAESELTPEQRHYLDIMVSNGNSLMDLINSILDLARIESGRLQLEDSQFDLTELVDRTVSTFAVEAHGKGLELVARIEPGTPNGLIGDPLRLRQIIINLLANAIKFTEKGGVVLEVEARLREAGQADVRFNVADTGIGIAPEHLKSIFANFTQADSSTSRKYGGSGLGLAISKRLTDLMHGKIAVASEVGKGTKFAVTVPFRLSSEAPTPAGPAMPDLFKHRVLVVDDHRINRQMVRETLTQWRAEVAEAGTADEALWNIRYAVAMNKPYQIVLLCMRMAEGGIALMQRIQREHLPITGVIPMLYSDDIRHQVAQIRGQGIELYLVKPITHRELYRVLGRKLAVDNGVSPLSHLTRMTSEPILSNLGEPIRILVAEDSEDNRFLIEAYLRNEPCTLTHVSDGEQACNKAMANDYDLILMDIQMPNTDGLVATRTIRQWEARQGRKPVPIIALTASALTEDVEQSLLAGCNSHISKPVKKRVILEAIRDVVQHRPMPFAILH